MEGVPTEMADDNSADDEREPETGTGAEGTESESETDDSTDDNDLAAQVARMKRALSKANREAAANRKRLSEYEDRDKTDQQKAAEKATAAEQRAQAAEAKLLRLEVAARKGLPAELALRLQGSTQEELEEDADALSKLLGDKGDRRSRRDPDQGKGNGRGDSDDLDMNDWMRRAAGVRGE